MAGYCYIVHPANQPSLDNAVIFSVFAANVLANHLIDEFVISIELHATFAVAAIPESIVQFLTVWCFVVNEKHIFFLAGDVRYHAITPSSLIHMPDNLSISFLTPALSKAYRPAHPDVLFLLCG